jgi:hypothetical protein
VSSRPAWVTQQDPEEGKRREEERKRGEGREGTNQIVVMAAQYLCGRPQCHVINYY